MKYRTLVKAGIRQHKAMLTGIFALVLLVTLSLATVLTVWTNADTYLRAELTRAGFGTLTAWVSNAPDMDGLTSQIEALADVERVETQRLVFANYTANGQESDSEGQLIAHTPESDRYRFFTDDLSGYRAQAAAIAQGRVYASPSFVSLLGLQLGDEINFAIARNGGSVALKVAGFYEDPFMGSSMIGMKGFLVSAEDYTAIVKTIQDAGIDALARDGAMLHVFKAQGSPVTAAALNSKINEGTPLPQFTEFVHSADAIAGFMLILQKAFSALLAAFVLVLLVVVLVVLGHAITGAIEADTVNMAILNTMGLTTKALRGEKLIESMVFILGAMLAGLALSAPVSTFVNSATLTTTGVRIPAAMPWGMCLGVLSAILLLLAGFIIIKTEKIGSITPMKAMRGETDGAACKVRRVPAISGKQLGLSLAVRQLATGRKKYSSACLVAALLAFFLATIGSMNTWLGVDGKGMMDAFNPADHDLGVQMFGSSTDEDARKIISQATQITDAYLLAMPSVAVNGIDYTANVISQPNRFHILSGRTCYGNNEIVVTEFVAADLGVSVGDALTVTGDSGSEIYTISGIYSCANDMGGNIGMSREGYLIIGKNDPQIWCHHYFLEDASQKAAITDALEAHFGGDVHVHENTWPGLFGIIFAMRALVVFLYAMVTIFILIVTAMTGGKILSAEQRDIGIYKALGFTTGQLRHSFALRFGIVALLGSCLGTLLAAALSNRLISTVMKLAGISNFAAEPDIVSALSPIVIVTLLFLGFAHFAAGKMKKTTVAILIAN